eukprot:GHVU01215395.1.p1 GENE.GHVU01215395.1~~GHVU01215395.1.p1  ORF type:complete len:106 (-),score=7.84 GHVU01215395.1:59-376(-)
MCRESISFDLFQSIPQRLILPIPSFGDTVSTSSYRGAAAVGGVGKITESTPELASEVSAGQYHSEGVGVSITASDKIRTRRMGSGGDSDRGEGEAGVEERGGGGG